MIVIPAIDLRDGLCVRLFQGDFERQTVYRDDPVELAREYRASGFDHLHVVDLDGAREGRQRNQAIVAAIAEASGMTVQVGGGIRDREALDCWLEAGVQRCVLGTIAAREIERVAGWIGEIGGERIVLALDVRGGEAAPTVATEGWSASAALTLWQCLDAYAGCGLKHVLCTDVGLDGTLRGPNLALYREFRERYPELALQASGGVRDRRDLDALSAIGCAAAITGRAVLEGNIRSSEVATCRRGA